MNLAREADIYHSSHIVGVPDSGCVFQSEQNRKVKCLTHDCFLMYAYEQPNGLITLVCEQAENTHGQ